MKSWLIKIKSIILLSPLLIHHSQNANLYLFDEVGSLLHWYSPGSNTINVIGFSIPITLKASISSFIVAKRPLPLECLITTFLWRDEDKLCLEMSSSVSLKSLQFVICFKVLVLSFVIDKLVGFDSRLFVSDVKQMTISMPIFHIRFPCFLNALLKKYVKSRFFQ